MKIGLSGLAAAAALAYSLLLGAANATVYTIEGQDIPPGMVSGTITTDGTLGRLRSGDIISTDLTVSDGANTNALDGRVFFLGSALTASSTGLFFNYSATGSSTFAVFSLSFKPQSVYCVSVGQPTCAGVEDSALIEVADTNYLGPVESGVVQIATASVVPEPATWTMMGLGFAGIGALAYRTRRKASVAA